MKNGHIGVWGLSALVLSSMIGGGVFALPQNVANSASLLAVLLGWSITFVGALGLVVVFNMLTIRKPELNSGVYAYARAGFGDLAGFNSAWGYWISALLGNVTYTVLIFAALSHMFPIFGDGNTKWAVVGASVALWVVHFLVLQGIKEAASINVATTVAKIVPLFIFIVIAVAYFEFDTFAGELSDVTDDVLNDSLFRQIQSTLIVNLWVFIGLEGANVLSARAKKRRDITRATLIGFGAAIVIYLACSILPFGLMSRAELAALRDPAMSGILQKTIGALGPMMISIAVPVSVLGSVISWTLLCAEVPYIAAKDGTMPSIFALENSRNVPSGSLWITNLLIQFFLVVVAVTGNSYLDLLLITTVLMLPPYLLASAYAFKLVLLGEVYAKDKTTTRRIIDGIFTFIALLYAVYLVYVAGVTRIFYCTILYLPGMLFYYLSLREDGRTMSLAEWRYTAVLLIGSIFAGYSIYTTGSLQV